MGSPGGGSGDRPPPLGLGVALGSWKVRVPQDGEGGGTFKQGLTWWTSSQAVWKQLQVPNQEPVFSS